MDHHVHPLLCAVLSQCVLLFQAVSEETLDSSAEVKKNVYEFDRDVTKGGRNPRTGKVCGEKVIRYFEDRMKHRVSTKSIIW